MSQSHPLRTEIRAAWKAIVGSTAGRGGVTGCRSRARVPDLLQSFAARAAPTSQRSSPVWPVPV